RGQGHKIVTTRQQSADMFERIRELEWDNRRLRDIVDVENNAEALRERGAVKNLRPLVEIEMEEMEMEETEMEEIEMVMGMEEAMAITLEDLCLLESAHIKTS
ncbi:hypothetical protein Tco_0036513, partial [Tanacetum coccineum]